MSLGRNWRIVALNSSGQQIATHAIVINARPWSFISGVATWGAIINVVASGDTSTMDAAISNTAYGKSNAVDNSSTGYLGMSLEISLTTPASANGTVTFWLQRSHDGGTTWPDNGNGTVIRTWTVAASTTYVDTIEI